MPEQTPVAPVPTTDGAAVSVSEAPVVGAPAPGTPAIPAEAAPRLTTGVLPGQDPAAAAPVSTLPADTTTAQAAPAQTAPADGSAAGDGTVSSEAVQSGTVDGAASGGTVDSAASGGTVDSAASGAVSDSAVSGAGPDTVPTGTEALPGADGVMPPGLDGAVPPDAVPVDPLTQIYDLLVAGGPVMFLLAGMSVIAAALIIAKLLQFATARLKPRRTVQQALALCRKGRDDEALALLTGDRSPVAQVMAAAVRGRCDPRVDEASAREESERIAALYLDRLSAGLRTLAAIATLSPLLGLLGTVLGMINAFQALESAGSKVDPSILSGGIWVALLTTAAGLVVAIPTAAAHQWMEGTVDKVARAMEDAATRVFTLQDPAGSPPSTAAVTQRTLEDSPFSRMTPHAQGAE